MDFFDWVRSVGGVAKAAKIAKVSERVMATWYYSERIPKPEAAKELIRATKGALCFNTIYGPMLAAQAAKQVKTLIKKGSKSDDG